MSTQKIPVIAIFDIGKTNKKFFLFNEDYKIVEEQSVNFKETEDEDGYACENIHVLSQWMLQVLGEYLHHPTYHIKAINFSAYGASFVHLNERGDPVTPLYNYLKPYPAIIEDQFYKQYGSKESIALTTASPALGNLNSGLQLYALKYTKADKYAQTKISLHLPQYLSYLISSMPYSDITSIGCHTALWNFTSNRYHSWVISESIDKKLPPVYPSDKAVDINFKGHLLKCGVGLHDSSAAFIPYIQCIKEPFLLISTGTWCISMNAFNNSPLTKEELEKDCLCYMTYEGTAVKSSRLFAGYEHEQQIKKLADYFNVAVNYFEKIAFRPDLINKQEDESKSLNEFDGTVYNSYEEAYHNFVNRLVNEQKKSTALVLNDKVKKIFVDGGFAKNEKYMNLLARAFPGMEVYAASVSQATALGAAMAIHNDWNRMPLPDNIVSTRSYYTLDVDA